MSDYSLDLSEKVSLAVHITHCLSLIHKKQIIHKDINPSNIIWNREKDRLGIIDFGIATELSREMTYIMQTGTMDGTLEYLSPEQTGRINRPVDCRSDLYSLGVTLYELFTGQLPFQWDDESEIIYSHIAREPEAPHSINNQVPEVLSKIILKLLAKDVENRYQMALGLEKDLESCLEKLTPQGDIPLFETGRFDFSNRLSIPNNLYGRQVELNQMNLIFENVVHGDSAVMMVKGNPGIGKSILVQEFSKSVALRRGFFISGKFDLQEQNIPLNAMIQAFQGLMNGLLSLPKSKLQHWKQRILEAMQQNGGVLTEMIPELEQIIGEQPPVVELNPIEAQNRFLLVCRDFINAFASEETPLVIFLDDLQWSDITTLNLLKYMAVSSSTSHLMIIGAYRQSDLKAGQPILTYIDEMEKEIPKVSTLSVQPLNMADIDQMLADTFRCRPDKGTLQLANQIYQKTRGNPFFINQLLNTLYHQGIFEFSVDQGKWTWDLLRIEEVNISDNLIDLLSQRIERLNPSALELLKLASCIGNRFDLNHLSMICNRAPMDIANTLWPAVKNEIIFPLNQNYRLMCLEKKELSLNSLDLSFAFQHDRIQQVVYSLIPQEEKQKIHLEIGREYSLYQKNRKESDFMFNVINHMNIGRALIHDFSERIILRDMNISVGYKALKSTAFSLAADYFSIALSLLSDEEWSQEPEEWFIALFNLGEALFLSGQQKKAEEICETMYPLLEDPAHQAKVHNLRARILEFQGRIPETIEEIRKGLKLLDINLPEHPDDIERRIGEGIMNMHKLFGAYPVEHLAELSLMEDKKIILAMELLYNLIPPALQFAPPLYILSALIMLELTEEFGVTPVSCKCFMDIAITQCPSLDDFSIGYRLGDTVFRLLERLNAQSLKPAVFFDYSFLSYRNAHYQEAVQYLDMAYSVGLQTGDLQHAAYARVHKLHLYSQIGIDLAVFDRETGQTLQFLDDIKAGMPRLQAAINQYMLKKYRSEKEIEEDQEMISLLEESRNIAFLWRFYQYNMVFHFINNQWIEAEKWSGLVDQFFFISQSDYSVPEHFFFKGLMLIRLWENFSEDDQPEKMIIITEMLENTEKASRLCPENFSHKYHFLAAEVGILKKKPLEEVLDQFNKALSSIKANDFIHMKALIHEALGRYWKLQGKEVISKAYITEACFLYKHWGAQRKSHLMEIQYPYLKKYFIEPRNSFLTSHTLTSSSIDMTSILKAMQVIHGEIRIEKLLRSLMSLILKNAGARQGALLLVNEDDNELYIEAEKKHFDDEIEVMQSLPYQKSAFLCPEVIQYVARSRNNVVLGNAWQQGDFRNQPSIQERQIKSVLSVPVIHRDKLMGVIYLEHDLAENVFTEERISILNILSSQASISIENARLYDNMEKKVEERTAQLNQAYEKFRKLSLLDPLTTLHNRRYISEFVSEVTMNFLIRKERLMETVKQRDVSINHKVIGVYLIDLDHFKMINDTYGHSVGDQVLISISRTLQKLIRMDDYIVRWGGEEFLIILNNTDMAHLDHFARKILQAVNETPLTVTSKKTLYNTCSVGYCMMPIHKRIPDFLNLEQTINLSDYVLYLAKERGRNCASRIHLKSQKTPSSDCRKYLLKLNKSDPVRDEFIEVTYIDNNKDD